MKLTPWYLMSINPVRVGVYEVKDMISTEYRQWSGQGWSSFVHPSFPCGVTENYFSPEEMAECGGNWRGVAK